MEPLSKTELAHFKREGYVIRRGALQPELLAAARDRLWASNTSATLRRGEPASYVGGFSEADQDCDRSGLNDRSSQYGWRCRSLSGDECMIDLLPRRLMPLLEQMVRPHRPPGTSPPLSLTPTRRWAAARWCSRW